MRRLALVALIAFSTPTLGAPAEDARKEAAQRIDEGNKRLAADDPGGALDHYEAAYAAFPSPKILLNIAEAQRALGRPAQAISSYRRFLSEAPPEVQAKLAPEVRSRLLELEREIGRIEISGLKDGTVIKMDGQEVGRFPIEGGLIAAPGMHQIDAELSGHQPQSATVRVTAGQRSSVELQSIPDKAALPEISAAPAVTAAPVEAADEGSPVTRWWFWTAIGAGVAGAAIIAIAASSGGGFLPAGELPATHTSDWRRF